MVHSLVVLHLLKVPMAPMALMGPCIPADLWATRLIQVLWGSTLAALWDRTRASMVDLWYLILVVQWVRIQDTQGIRDILVRWLQWDSTVPCNIPAGQCTRAWLRWALWARWGLWVQWA